MGGGLLNLVSVGNQNVILNGNPQKTFFKSTYKKYSNFGMQKFRIDYNGIRELRLSEDSVFNFKIPRYAELLMDTYLVMNLPDIWSPIHPPREAGETYTSENWIPYQFKWIKNIGSMLIKEITLTAGGTTLQRFTGEYLLAQANRDLNGSKKQLYDAMTGHTERLHSPDSYDNREGVYPNAVYSSTTAGAEPSIRGQQLFIPLNFWFTMNSKQAFPLVSMQYNELYINVTLRPVSDLFTIRDVTVPEFNYPRISPNFNVSEHQFHRFIQTPPQTTIDSGTQIATVEYGDLNTRWNADIHLIANYCFLTDDESRIFAGAEQKYLIKEIHEHNFTEVTGSKKVQLDSFGLVSSYMFLFQRNDVNLRNEWSNYTNWAYDSQPYKLYFTSDISAELYHTGDYKSENHKPILTSMSIVLDGDFRENTMTAGVYEYVEKYVRTPSSGLDPYGLYAYNFCINTDPFDTQPNGAINMSKFSKVELQFTTYIPTLDPSASYQIICDPVSGAQIGVVKPSFVIYNYNYDLRVLEERYNVVTFIGGNVGLMNAR